MKIQTFSIVVGTKACDAHCPFCVSRMTGFEMLEGTIDHKSFENIDQINFAKASRLAQMNGTTTVLLTGKGEPTLYPVEILWYLDELKKWQFPFVEMQTNGLIIGDLAAGEKHQHPHLREDLLVAYRERGLNTIAISVVDVRPENNAIVYRKNYPDLARTIHYLHHLGFTVRLCVMMMKGMVDSVERVDEVIAFCRQHQVEQLTIRPIRKPKQITHSDETSAYVAKNGLEAEQEEAIVRHYLHENRFQRMMTLSHNAVILDVNGQNVCLSDCLNETGENDEIRTLIFYSDGRLTYSWDHDSAAVLLGGRHKSEI